jgi:hypothetical protein
MWMRLEIWGAFSHPDHTWGQPAYHRVDLRNLHSFTTGFKESLVWFDLKHQPIVRTWSSAATTVSQSFTPSLRSHSQLHPLFSWFAEREFGIGFQQFNGTAWRFDVINTTTRKFSVYNYITTCALHDDILPPIWHDLWPVSVRLPLPVLAKTFRNYQLLQRPGQNYVT